MIITPLFERERLREEINSKVDTVAMTFYECIDAMWSDTSQGVMDI